MKRLVYALLAVAVLLPTIAQAELNKKDALPKTVDQKIYKAESVDKIKVEKVKGKDQTQDRATWVPLINVNGMVWNGGNSLNNTAYDPVSGTFYWIGSFNTNVAEEGEDQDLDGELRVLYTQNLGTAENPPASADFMEEIIYSSTTNAVGMASIAVQNTSGTTNPLEPNMGAITWIYPESSNYFAEGVSYVVKDDNGNFMDDLEVFGPFSNENGGSTNNELRWGIPKIYTHEYEGMPYYFNVASLSPEEGSNEVFGQNGIGVVSADLSEASFYIDMVWSQDNYPTTSEGGSYSTPLYFSIDEAGNLYGANFNFNTDQDISTLPENPFERVPSITKNSSRGMQFEWSEMDVMDQSLLEAWYESVGGFAATTAAWLPGSMAYTDFDLMALAEDHVVMALPMVIWNSDDEATPIIALAEYKDNDWSMEIIAELQENIVFYDAFYPEIMRDTVTVDGMEPFDYFTGNFRGYEVQLAMTDAGELVCKWIDYSPNYVQLDEPILLNGEAELAIEDSIYSTDIYIAYKSDLNSNTWSEKVNISDDDIFNKATNMPPRIPSLNQIPMTQLQFAGSFTQTYAYRESLYPEFFYEYFYDGANQTVHYSTLSAGEVNSVRTDKIKFAVDVTEPYPNPATNSATIGYTLEQAAQVNIDLYNSMGVKVADIHDGYKSAGFNAETMELNSVASGTYFIYITIDGVSLGSKVLNVVK